MTTAPFASEIDDIQYGVGHGPASVPLATPRRSPQGSLAPTHAVGGRVALARQLESALETRGIIERAVGIMMSRSGGTEHEALQRLQAFSQHEHRKLVVVARQIIDEAVRRAQARCRSD